MESESKAKLDLQPTFGVVDYAADYKGAIRNGAKIIESAKYFMDMRREHIKEILESWDNVADDFTLEEAEIILNEFLSPRCTLLEFEYKNLTKRGREQREAEKNGETRDSMNHVWQKHILGKVLTDQSEQEGQPSVSIPEYFEPMEFGKSDNCIAIYTIYNQILWFINNKKIQTTAMSRKVNKEVRKAIKQFERAFDVTRKTVNILCYMEILESSKKGVHRMLSNTFVKIGQFLNEGRDGSYSKETEDLLKCADLFITRHKSDLDQDAIFRCGFDYLNEKLQMLKNNQESYPNVITIASRLAEEEILITQCYDVLKKVHSFENWENVSETQV